MSRLTFAAVAVCIAIATGPVSAADDGFPAFWKAFAAAMSAGDEKAAAELVAFPLEYGEKTLDRAGFATAWKGLFTAKNRKCLAKEKPLMDKDGDGKISYMAFCNGIIFIFEKVDGAWKFRETHPDD
mgnify:CR=1 FL=1